MIILLTRHLFHLLGVQLMMKSNLLLLRNLQNLMQQRTLEAEILQFLTLVLDHSTTQSNSKKALASLSGASTLQNQ